MDSCFNYGFAIPPGNYGSSAGIDLWFLTLQPVHKRFSFIDWFKDARVYADDTALYNADRGYGSSALLASRRALEQASSWFSANRLGINAGKTQQIHLTMDRRTPRRGPVTLLTCTWLDGIRWIESVVSCRLAFSFWEGLELCCPCMPWDWCTFL